MYIGGIGDRVIGGIGAFRTNDLSLTGGGIRAKVSREIWLNPTSFKGANHCDEHKFSDRK